MTVLAKIARTVWNVTHKRESNERVVTEIHFDSNIVGEKLRFGEYVDIKPGTIVTITVTDEDHV